MAFAAHAKLKNKIMHGMNIYGSPSTAQVVQKLPINLQAIFLLNE